MVPSTGKSSNSSSSSSAAAGFCVLSLGAGELEGSSEDCGLEVVLELWDAPDMFVTEAVMDVGWASVVFGTAPALRECRNVGSGISAYLR